LFFKWDMTYRAAWKTTITDQFLPPFYTKKWHGTGSYMFTDTRTLQTVTKVLTVMTQTITDYGNQDAYWTCWVTLLKLLCLFLPVDKTMVLGTGSLNCKPKKHRCFGIKVYKLCSVNECTYDTVVYLGKNRPHVTTDMTAACTADRPLTKQMEGPGHKLYMDSFFPITWHIQQSDKDEN
jgi:hypothetical protein